MVMDVLVFALALYGLWLLWRRLAPRAQSEGVPESSGRSGGPLVSIIVPARNEAHHLADLLDSLARLDYDNREVIVVDDRSEDGTKAVAERYGVTVIEGAPRPEGWNGKQWACQQGADAARGKILLFTDADTVHEPEGLGQAVAFLQTQNAHMLSCLPCHVSPTWWERLCGPFHVLLLAVTAPEEKPRPGRVYAIGQYLMFTREGYDRLGGHAAVKDDYVEDMPLANLALKKNLSYVVWTAGRPVKVRMYDTPAAFFQGWRRNFRAGLKDSHWTAPLEVTAMIAALTGAGQAFATPIHFAMMITAVTFVALRQKRLGRFSPWGAILFPVSVAAFCAITATVAYDTLTGRKLEWKGRSYDAPSPAPAAPLSSHHDG